MRGGRAKTLISSFHHPLPLRPGVHPWKVYFWPSSCPLLLPLATMSTSPEFILQVKRLSPHAVLPFRATEGAAGYDLCRCAAPFRFFILSLK